MSSQSILHELKRGFIDPLEQDAEMMRLQVLGDPQLMRQLQEVRDYYSSIITAVYTDTLSLPPFRTQTQPEIALPAQSDPTRFAELRDSTETAHNKLSLTPARDYSAQCRPIRRRGAAIVSKRLSGSKQSWRTWSMRSSTPQKHWACDDALVSSSLMSSV